MAHADEMTAAHAGAILRAHGVEVLVRILRADVRALNARTRGLALVALAATARAERAERQRDRAGARADTLREWEGLARRRLEISRDGWRKIAVRRLAELRAAERQRDAAESRAADLAVRVVRADKLAAALGHAWAKLAREGRALRDLGEERDTYRDAAAKYRDRAEAAEAVIAAWHAERHLGASRRTTPAEVRVHIGADSARLLAHMARAGQRLNDLGARYS